MSKSEPAKIGDPSKRGLDLGWLAGSGVQPSKRREIEGVGAASIMDLQAQLFQAQEDAKLRQSGQLGGEATAVAQRKGLHVKNTTSEATAAAQRRGSQGKNSALNHSNAGVEERNQKDMQHVKTSSQRISEAYAALERKAALYEKLAKGIEDDDAERYEVDFLSKGEWAQQGQQDQGPSSLDNRHTVDAPQQPVEDYRSSRPPYPHSDDSDDSDDDRHRERRVIHTQEEREQAARRQQHKEVVMQLAQQTKQQRERAAEVKRLKEQQSQSKVNKLKQEFLKKQLAAKLSGSKPGKS